MKLIKDPISPKTRTYTIYAAFIVFPMTITVYTDLQLYKIVFQHIRSPGNADIYQDIFQLVDLVSTTKVA